MPFILRGVSLRGVDSANMEIGARRALWGRMAGDLRPRSLERIVREVSLEEVDDVLSATLGGGARGRTVVRVTG
jgi:acrylyl-CoA reductase (NADPH)